MICAIALAALTGTATAHALPGSAVLLDFNEHDVGAELRLPLADLEIGFTHDLADPDAQRIGPQPFTVAPSLVLPVFGEQIAAYVARHVRPSTLQGEPWSVSVHGLSLDRAQTPLDLVVQLRLQPPVGASVDRFRLDYDVITHEVRTHEALVSVRRDWNNGVLADSPQLLGRVRWVVDSIEVDRPAGSLRTGLMAAVRMGAQHIAEGSDHLMFLFTLLLAAPLVAIGGQWIGHSGSRRTVGKLAKVVSAFTIGHTITLVAGAHGWLALPDPPVEIAIAVSILVSAIHVWRPLFAGREAWVAGGFGLIHGAAFASAISAQGFEGWHAVWALFGFNLGIELMQLAVVAAGLPLLLWVAQRPGYAQFRRIGSAFAGLCAIGWIAERTGVSPALMSGAGTVSTTHAAIAAGLLAGASALVWRHRSHDSS